MWLRKAIRSWLRMVLGVEVVRVRTGTYDFDGLRSIHNHDFMKESSFVEAYERGVEAAGRDDQWYWRVHVGLWAGAFAARLRGDFVECGVNWGFLSSAIMHYLDWDRHGKTFYLFDTFAGLDPKIVSETERRQGAMEQSRRHLASGHYAADVDAVRANFSQWRNVRVVQGSVPDILAQSDISEVAYVHLDMNCALPTVGAAEFFWPRMVQGAMMLMDDYAYRGYETQKSAMDEFARSKGVEILSLPTGQGLLLRPPR